MSRSRAFRRNVHFFDESRPSEALGGLTLNESTVMTHDVFLSMLEILIIASEPYEVRLRGTADIVRRTNDPLQRGNYDIRCQSPIQLNDEPVLTRAASHTVSGRDNRFQQQLRSRDGRCVITHIENPHAEDDNWDGFEGAHIFPMAHESFFRDQNYSRWITNRASGDTGINSCQNGMLLCQGAHTYWDQYNITVSPDHDYLIITFRTFPFGLVRGNRLHPICRQPGDDRAVRDELLRWHFRQAVLTNMRGAGEPLFELDFPPGTDMVGEIRNGPRAAERMEFELFSRLQEPLLEQDIGSG